MISIIKGDLIDKFGNILTIDTGNLAFEVTTENKYASELVLQQKITLFVRLIIKETEWQIFGFKEQNLRNLFNFLLLAPGIGPQIGLRIISNNNFSDIINAIADKNSKFFTATPGIGDKGAQKLI